MTIREAKFRIEQLDNDYEYYLREKEELLSLVIPKAADIKGDKVDGGTRVDRLSKYVELEDEKKLNETLDYIDRKRKKLLDWLDNELRSLGKYNEKSRKIYEMRNDEEYIKRHGGKPMEFWKIGNAVGLCEKQVRRIYSRIVNRKYID